jgi:hypothetical protein
VTGAPASASAPAAKVKAAQAAAARSVAASDVASEDLVPLATVVPRPPSAVPLWVVMLGLMVAAVVFAFTVELGTVERTGTIPPGTVTVAGGDPSAGRPLTLDLTKPLAIQGRLPAGAEAATGTSFAFTFAGAPLGEGKGGISKNADGTFSTTADATIARWTLAGNATGKLSFLGPDGTIAAQEFEVDTTKKPWSTALPWVAVVLLVMALSYAESMLRALRQGRKRVAGLAGMTLLGVPVGGCITVLAWAAKDAEPARGTVAGTMALAAVGGLAAAWAAIASGRRRQAKRAEKLQPAGSTP